VSAPRWLAAALVVVSWLASTCIAGAADSFEYLYVEPNTGAASGGHAAIRFGDETYHFQHEAGLVRAVREPSEHFDYVYRAVGNRSVHATRIAISEQGYDVLRDAFRKRHLIEDEQLEAFASARRDRAFLDYLARRETGTHGSAVDTGVRLRGGGYFVPAGGRRPRALDRVARAILARHGPDYLEQRAAALDRAVAALAYACRPASELSAERLPDPPCGLADAYARLVLARMAVDVLRGDRVPDPRAFRFTRDPSFRLGAREIARLHAAEERLEARAVSLAASVREDWGYPLLVALARLVATEASLESRTLVVLDVYEDDPGSVTAAELFGDGDLATTLLVQAREDFLRGRSKLFSAEEPAEELWSRLELDANALLELDRAERTGASLRIAPDVPVPSRMGVLDEHMALPALGGADLAKARALSERRAEALHADLRRLYRYDVVELNCVTEIFRTIDSAMTAAPGLLGGHVDGREGLNFIPLVSAATVGNAYRVIGRTTLPSYRRYWLDRLSSEEGALETRLRESNVLTSHVYNRAQGDDLFLFFTDDTTALRPLFGAANVLVAAGSFVPGMLALPFDRGSLLVTATRSLLFSAPEIVFVNIRKGANRTLPRAWTEHLVSAQSGRTFDAGARVSGAKRLHRGTSRGSMTAAVVDRARIAR
jgi:hypothetical protein